MTDTRPPHPSREAIARTALLGMLAHPTRYRPRPEDAHLHWHEAIAKEAFEIADAMIRAERASND